MRVLIADLRKELRGAGLCSQGMAVLCVALPALLYVHSLADIAISIVAVTHLCRSALTKDFAWARQTWVRIALVFWAYIVVRGLFSLHPEASGGTALVWVRYVIFTAALQMLAVRAPVVLRAMLAVFVAATLFGAADTLFQFVVGHDVYGRPMLGERLTGPLHSAAIGNLILFSGLPALAVMFTWLSAAEPSIRRKVLAVGGILLIGVAVFLSGERMSLILLGAGLLLCLLLVARSTWRVNLVLLAVSLIVAAGLYAAFPQVLARHLSALTVLTIPREAMYVEIWQSAVQVFAANPLFGIGVHNFRLDCALYVVPADLAAAGCASLHPHHLWLEFLAETGVVGTAIILAFFGAALAPVVREWRLWPSQPLLAGAAISVALRLWPIASAKSFFVNQNEVVFWCVLAAAVAAAHIARGSSAPS